jgi:hypothetical protein
VNQPIVKSVLLFIFCWMLCVSSGLSQDTIKRSDKQQVINGDTLEILELYPVVIFPERKNSGWYDTKRYDKLVYNVRKVYPFAKLAGEKLRYYKQILDTIPSEKGRKRFIKQAQKELESQFGDQLKELTFSQGKILIKLIYRETGNSTFDIVKELRGGFQAFIYQTMARIFGYNLKSGYDPEGEDQVIEQIVRTIESENQPNQN